MSSDINTSDVRQHIRRILQLTGPELLAGELAELSDQVEASFDAYATSSKRDVRLGKDTPKRRGERQEILSKSIGNAINRMRKLVGREASSVRSEKRLRNHIHALIDALPTDLKKEEKRKIEDRMIRLFDEYARAPKAQRAETYARGEEELFATLDASKKPRTMTASGGAF